MKKFVKNLIRDLIISAIMVAMIFLFFYVVGIILTFVESQPWILIIGFALVVYLIFKEINQ